MFYQTTAEFLADRVISDAVNDDMFCNAFCEGCEDGHVSIDYECRAAWCPDDKRCARYSRYEQFRKTIRQAFTDALNY